MPLSPFQSVTRVAIEEMIRSHGTPSKFGLFIAEADVEALVSELVRLLETSRSLRAAGDRHLQQNPQPRADIRHNVKT